METPRVRLGELLVKSGLLTQEQLEEALVLQKRDGRRLGTLLVESGLVNETQVTQVLSQQLSVPWVSLHHIDFSRQLLNLVPDEVARSYCLVPIYVRRVRGLGEALYVAMDDPTNAEALEKVAAHSGLHVRAMIAPPSDIVSAIEGYYGGGAAHARVSADMGDEETTAVRSRAELQSSEGQRHEPAARTAGTSSGTSSAVGVPPPKPRSEEIPRERGSAPDAAGGPPSASDSAVAARDSGMPQPKEGAGARLISLTLLDGTTINLPARSAEADASSAPRAEDQLTARDLVAALRAAAHGADASEILGEEARWERMFASLLSLLLKKHLIADWEFIEEYKKS